MQYAVCCVAVSPLRKEPYHQTEMISQQLFGECSTVIDTSPGWAKVRAKYDGYEGWCQAAHLLDIDEEQFFFGSEILAAEHENKIIFNGEKMYIPLGSCLSTFKKQTALWQNKIAVYKGQKWDPYDARFTKKNIKRVARYYLNSPYLWGGKSVYGIDCSGFSQMVFKFINICLPRDAAYQALEGNAVDSLANARCGDLCFFNNEEGRITHVGILLNPHTIIHSSGKVRIDEIDEEGIINRDTKERTHKLKSIKKYFDLEG